MTRMGDTARECIKLIEREVKEDLDNLLETSTTVTFYKSNRDGIVNSFDGFTNVADQANLDLVDFSAFKSDASQLEVVEVPESTVVKLTSNLLRSNCRVTNQPDWGDVFIQLKGTKIPTAESIAKYIVSHRTVSHFHEEICEMIFKHLTDAFNPEELMVACLYTRRGGLDINPIRATHSHLIPDFFINPLYRIEKTLRQ